MIKRAFTNVPKIQICTSLAILSTNKMYNEFRQLIVIKVSRSLVSDILEVK